MFSWIPSGRGWPALYTVASLGSLFGPILSAAEPCPVDRDTKKLASLILQPGILQTGRTFRSFQRLGQVATDAD
jgi:hypothetical protein